MKIVNILLFLKCLQLCEFQTVIFSTNELLKTKLYEFTLFITILIELF